MFTEGLANWVPAAQVPEFGQVFVSRNLAAQPMQYQAPMAPVQVAAPQKSNSSNTVIIIAVVALLLIGGGIASYFLFFNKNSHRSTDDYDEQTEEVAFAPATEEVASDTAWAEAAAEEASAADYYQYEEAVPAEEIAPATYARDVYHVVTGSFSTLSDARNYNYTHDTKLKGAIYQAYAKGKTVYRICAYTYYDKSDAKAMANEIQMERRL